MNENELLRRFVEENAQDAFAELVRGKIDLIYTAALRQVGGDTHLAQDVTQGVFLALACQAAHLRRHAVLTGWLFTTTRFLAAKALRGQRRWQRRETEANVMNDASPDRTDAAWQELRPVIDEVMHELGEADRTVVLLRFFEGRTLAEIGAAVGVTENAARMRVDRALEKLRTRLARRGIISTAAALGAALASQPVVAAPASLVPAVTGVALGCITVGSLAGVGGATAALLNFMSTTKLVLGTAGAVAVFGLGAIVGNQPPWSGGSSAEKPAAAGANAEFSFLQKENSQLKEQLEQFRLKQAAGAPSKAGSIGSGGIDALTGSKKWALLAELSKQKLMTSQIMFIDGAGKIDEGMASVFDLTPGEQTALSQAVGSAREKLEALERANTTVVREPDGSIIISAKPFPVAGGGVYDEMMNGIAQTLGPERNAAFMTLCADQVEKALGAFGASERKVTVSKQPDSKNNRYSATDERIAPGNHSKSTRNYRTREELLGKVGTIIKLLPPDF